MVLRKLLVLAVFAAAVVAMVGSSALAQRRGPRGGFGGPGGKLMMLRSEEVQKELEVSDEQKKDLEKLRDDMRTQMREVFSGMRELPEDQRRAAFEKARDKMRGVTQEMETKVNRILLPHQVERLNQLDVQTQIQRRGTDAALGSDAMVKALGITDAQKKQIQDVAAQAQKEMQETVNKAREEARKKVLAVLTKEQQEKLNKMIGEQFTMPDRGPRGNRPGR